MRNLNSLKWLFVIRNGKITSDNSYDQIRNPFDLTATLVNKARHLIDQRIALVAVRKSPHLMEQVSIYGSEFFPFAGNH